jgi:hypothetical protein
MVLIRGLISMRGKILSLESYYVVSKDVGFGRERVLGCKS